MNKYYGWGLPADLSTHGFQIDRLIYIIHALMALLLVGWLIFLVIAIFRFRSRPGHRATYQANHFKAPTYIEVAIAILEIVLLVGFSFPIVYQTRAALPPKDQSLEIRVVAEQCLEYSLRRGRRCFWENGPASHESDQSFGAGSE